MGLAVAIPGMRPGRTKRNLAVVTGYLMLLPLLLVGAIIAIPFVVSYAVGRNYNGLAEKLDRLPGISSSGGATAGVVAFVYVILAMGALGAVLPGAEQTGAPADNASLAGEDGANASVEGGATAISPTPTTTDTPASSEQEHDHDDEGGTSVETGDDAATPTATQSPPPPTATSTSSDAATATATPTLTPSPTPTSSPTPTPTPEPRTSGGERTATVLRVIDGDTLKVRLDNGTEDTVRLLGVDTPETQAENSPEEWEGVPDTDAGKECLREAGHDASDWIQSQVADETVRLEFDANEGKRGYYGRLLAYVYLDGEHVNYQLVERGHARVYDSSFEKRSSFYAAESDAQAQELGAWRCRNVESSTPTPTPTDGSSGSDGDLAVVHVHADAEGNDHENDEYIVFENTGDSTLDLSGWTVSDEADHTYRVPAGSRSTREQP